MFYNRLSFSRVIISLLTILGFVLTSFSQIQKAELVFKDGDTIEGFGMITKNGKIKFKVSLEDKPEVFNELIVKEIIFYGANEVRIFEYIKTKERVKKQLLEVISYGKVNLYEKRFTTYTNNSSNGEIPITTVSEDRTLYMKRKEEDVATKIGFNFKKVAKAYFKDCDIILELINSGEFRNMSRERIIDEYNVFCED